MAEPATSGKVLLKISSIGDIVVELWPKECPKACRNFVQLCLEGYYDGTVFHRLLPGFLVQGGDPTGTGTGGESIYDEGTFEDEISQRLRFNRRGLLAMANTGRKHTNASQFFFTLDRADNLYGSNTLFGTVANDTLFNLLKFNELEVDALDDRPVYPPAIRSTEVLDNPFPDIVPRITAKERREQADARKDMKKARSKEQKRGKAIKNAGLLSFADDPDAQAAKPDGKTGMRSAHDLLSDATLSKEVKDDRGLSATLPESFLSLPSAAKPAREPAAAPRSKAAQDAFEYTKPEAGSSKADKDDLQEQIALVAASLKALKKKRRAGSSDEEAEAGPAASKKKQKAKAADDGIDGAALLTAEREAYLNSGKATRKGQQADDASNLVLGGFRNNIREARKAALDEEKLKPPEEAPVVGYSGEVLEEEEYSDDNDMSFMSHKLKFRKDVTADRASRDVYVTIDPREQGMTLEDARFEEERRRRKGEAPALGLEADRPKKQRHEKGGIRSKGYSKGEVDRDWRGQSSRD